MKSTQLTVTLVTLVGAAGCAYFNGLYNANRLAKEARRAEEQGRRGEARSLWAQAAVKAESVVVRYPTSKHRDDALIMHGRALSRLGECGGAVTPLTEAVESSPEPALRMEARLLLATCYLEIGQPESARLIVSPVVDSWDPDAVDRALLIRGRAALAGGDPPAALADLDRTRGAEAVFDRAAAYIEMSRIDAALMRLDSARALPYDESRWSMLLRRLGAHDVRGAARLVDSLSADRALTEGQRARLLIEDGLRWRGVDDDLAAARFSTAVSAAGDSTEAGIAHAHDLMLEVTRTRDIDRLSTIAADLDAVMMQGGASVPMAGRFAQILDAVVQALNAGDGVEARLFRRAEEVRDSLGALPLASELFTWIARNYAESVIAPKALLAAAALRAEIRDSVVDVLSERYPDSPYTRVILGLPSPDYAAVEDSLRVVLDREALSPISQVPESPLVPWQGRTLPDTGRVRS